MTIIAFNTSQQNLMNGYAKANPDSPTFTKKALTDFAISNGHKPGTVLSVIKKVPKLAYGVYQMAGVSNVVQMPITAPESASPAHTVAQVMSTSNDEVYIPKADATFVKWGYFKDVKLIIDSGMFYPMYVAGLSGNGKTMMIEQACAASGREYVRVQITPETDEDDLIGGFRLLNGETVFAKGPVIKAMEAGAILLIDEIDRGSNKLMCLQGVLEGKPVMIKKTGEVINPAKGFNVIATANTKGQGDEAGRFIAATIIDEAFLERFTVTLEQPYPNASIETKIVKNHMSKFGVSDVDDFTTNLIKWGQAIRKTFEDGGVDDIVSTRRLCHIVQTFSIFNDRQKSIELCVNRFDPDTRAAFLDLYGKIDAGLDEMNDQEDGTFSFEEDSPF
tara:strand:- start:312 stop:1481 length:1170 start_codon:yes stop_codon:yes gene_type:complete